MKYSEKLLCSTGTMVGRVNGYDYIRALNAIHDFRADGICDGGELMMLKFYYDKLEILTSAAKEREIPFPVIHFDKEIGSLLSEAGRLDAEGKGDEADKALGETLKLFSANCRFGESVKAEKAVLHLWGGYDSDNHIKYNSARLPWLIKEAEAHGLELLIENVPSSLADPLTNWRRIVNADKRVSLIYDTRFAALHRQSEEILTDADTTRRIRHVHISDFIGEERDFSALRPIYHPTEGIVNFEKTAELLGKFGYDGTFTLESPVMNEDESIDVEKLKRSLTYVRRVFGC